MALKKNEKIAIGIVGGVILYLLFKKPKFYVVDKGGSNGGGGGGGAFPVIMPTITPAPAPAPVQPNCKVGEKYNEATKKCEPTNSFPTCKTGEMYNPATRKCEPIIDVPMSDKSVKDALKDAQTGGGLVVTPYDPCKDNGYGGTYDANTNSCLKSPFCGGNDLLLDSNGKMKGCKADIPSGSGTGGVVGGVVGFSGKLPLTLDNLLM
jgi:hypothetical protein